MHAEASTEKLVEKGTFVDVGMNLGTCSAHIAMLGFPVVAVEPVDQHVHAMHSTLAMSPAMSVDVFFGGIAHAAGESKVQILSAGRNFGASKTVFVNEYTSEESRFQRNHVLELYDATLTLTPCTYTNTCTNTNTNTNTNTTTGTLWIL